MTRKSLSADGMIANLKKCFQEIPEHRSNQENIQFSIPDAALSAFSMFSLKYPSLLSFTNIGRSDSTEGRNLRSLYQIENVPSDTQMRTILDGVDTRNFRDSFLKLFSDAQRGGILKNFEFMDGKYLAAFDGTGVYSSNNIHCDNCMEKVSKKTGEISYYHQTVGVSIIHPEVRQVIPLCPEPIQKQDGTTKNDCERNGTKRVLDDLKQEHPRLELIIVEDALSANAPHIRKIKNCGYNYILGVKPGDHKYLFDWVDALDGEDLKTHSYYNFIGEKVKKKVTHQFSWCNEVPLNDSNSDLNVNFLGFKEITETLDNNGEVIKTKTSSWTWVTDIKITKDNAVQIMKGGRARWRIENEVFNTLKNQGYNLEHNFGHGFKNLCNNFIMLMMLAFLVDQLQEIACSTFKKAFKVSKRKQYLWEKIRVRFLSFVIDSWETLFNSIINPPVIVLNSG